MGRAGLRLAGGDRAHLLAGGGDLRARTWAGLRPGGGRPPARLPRVGAGRGREPTRKGRRAGEGGTANAARRRVRVAPVGGVGRPRAARCHALHRAAPPRRRRVPPARRRALVGGPADAASQGRPGAPRGPDVSGRGAERRAATPGWHDLPDRTGDPAIERARLQRLAIAIARRATKDRATRSWGASRSTGAYSGRSLPSTCG